MKKNIHQNLWGLLKSKAVLGVSAGMILMSCGAYTGGYSETDGVYYDPNTDTLPEGTINNQTGNRVGEYYDYQDSTNIIEKSRQNEIERKNRYQNDNWSNDSKSQSSDWGTYSGSETHYNSWGYPYGYGYGFYPRYGWGGYYGMNFGWGSGFGWYDPFFDFGPWGYNSYFGYYPWGYSPYYYRYKPYYGYYSPYSYYSPYGYGSYYGYGNPYYGNNYYYRAPQRKSGADGIYNSGTPTNRMSQQNGGMRSGNTSQRPVFNQDGAQPRMRGTDTNRVAPTQRQAPVQRQIPQERSQPRFENNRSFENRTFENRSYDGGGFRSGGGFNSGSSSSGTSRSGGGGMRTGGGRF